MNKKERLARRDRDNSKELVVKAYEKMGLNIP